MANFFDQNSNKGPVWTREDERLYGPPTMEGAVKGYLARQQYDLANNQDKRQEEMLGIAKEELGIKKDYLKIAQDQLGIQQEDLGMRKEKHQSEMYNIRRQQMIQQGLGDAFKEGGWAQAVDFLAANGMPEEAIKMHAAKLELDDKIMQQPVMAQKTKNELAEAKMAAYGVGGSLAKILMNTPPEERQAQYERAVKTFQPILGKEILPDKFDANAALNLTMMMAQGTNQNQRYLLNKSVEANNTEIGQLGVDIATLQKQGATYENNPTLATMIDKRDAIRAQAKKDQLELHKVQAETVAAEQQGQEARIKNTMDVIDRVNKDPSSQAFIKMSDAYSQTKNALNILSKDENNFQAQSAIMSAYTKMMENGDITDKDMQLYFGKEKPSWFSKIPLVGNMFKGADTLARMEPKQIKELGGAIDTIYNNKVAQQMEFEKSWVTQMQQNPLMYDMKSDPISKFPSAVYLKDQMQQNNMKAGENTIRQNPWLQGLKPQLQEVAVDAIAKAKTPEEIDKIRIKSMMLMRQEQMQQQGNSSMSGGGMPNGQ